MRGLRHVRSSVGSALLARLQALCGPQLDDQFLARKRAFGQRGKPGIGKQRRNLRRGKAKPGMGMLRAQVFAI
eukprot:gene7563-biopygen7933